MSAQPFYTLDDLRRWDEISESFQPPARLAVIGNPVAHSRSPQMHNAGLQARGIDAQYIRVQVNVGEVAEALRLFSQLGFIGINCTVPHKFEALAAVEEVDPLAEELGAVNTVAFDNGRPHGYNSDGPGFIKSAEEAFGASIYGLRVLVIGAGGGAGRAVSLQCAIAGCKSLVLMNRTVEKIQGLAAECSRVCPSITIQVKSWTSESLQETLPDVDLIVNATTLGMKEDDRLVLDPELLHPSHLVYDMVYRAQGETPLIEAAKKRGARTCDGLLLLLHQGGVSFDHWFGHPVPLAEMRQGLLDS